MGWNQIAFVLVLIICYSHFGKTHGKENRKSLIQALLPKLSSKKCILEGSIVRCENGASFNDLSMAFEGNQTEISNVYMESCKISTLGMLLRSKNLQVISVVGSGLQDVTTDAFQGHETTLIELNLSKNRLNVVPKAVAGLKVLIHLDLSGNRIKSLLPPSNVQVYRGIESWENLSSLSTLNLGNNRYISFFCCLL